MCTSNEVIGLTLGGQTGLNAVTQVETANAAAKAQEAQARDIATQAGQNDDAANAQAARIRAAAKRARAEARAAFSASGVSVDGGTPLVIDQQIGALSESDALNAILSADRQGAAYVKDAAALGETAKQTRKAGKLAAFNTVLSAAASAAGSSGWRSNGPGFSGTQAPAPITDRSIRINQTSKTG